MLIAADSIIRIEIDMPKVLNKVQNDEFGMFLIREWKRLINPYTPHRVGLLEERVLYEPFKMTYTAPYARYMYGGEIYVDPIFKASGFTKDGGIHWKSRRDVDKIPSGRHFNYSKDKNHQATDHWDKAAEKAGQKDKLIDAANLYLGRRS